MHHSVAVVGAVLVLLSVLEGRTGLRWVDRYNRVAQTATSAIRTLRSTGTVKLSGTVRTAEQFESPVGQRECVLAVWQVEEWWEGNKTSKWRTEATGVYVRPFAVDDGTGQLEVDLRERSDGGERVFGHPRWLDDVGAIDPDVQLEVDDPEEVIEHQPGQAPPHLRRLTGGEGLSEPMEAMVESLDWGRQQGARRYLEQTVGAGDEVFVLGPARADPDATRPLGGGDLSVRPPADGPIVVSDCSEATLKRVFGTRMLLVPGALLVALAGVALAVVGPPLATGIHDVSLGLVLLLFFVPLFWFVAWRYL